MSGGVEKGRKGSRSGKSPKDRDEELFRESKNPGTGGSSSDRFWSGTGVELSSGLKVFWSASLLSELLLLSKLLLMLLRL